jgi:hypothetical protein
MNTEQIFLTTMVGIVCLIIGAIVGAKSKALQGLIAAGEAEASKDVKAMETDIVGLYQREAAAVESLVQQAEAGKARLAQAVQVIQGKATVAVISTTTQSPTTSVITPPALPSAPIAAVVPPVSTITTLETPSTPTSQVGTTAPHA